MTAGQSILSELLRKAADDLRAAGVPDAMVDARLLAAAACALSREEMLLEPHLAVQADAAARFRDMVERRCRREPVARILGSREFRSLDFGLGPDTLEPRPDSETIVDAAVLYGRAMPGPIRVLDLGTGTGCLVLSVLDEIADATGVGSDIAAGAIEVASRNAENLGLADRVRFLHADWTAGLDGPFDLILSNPPYITTGEIAGLAPEVAAYDPAIALDGGVDGLDAYRTLAACVAPVLSSEGIVVLEIGAGQQDEVTSIFATAGYAFVDSRDDLGGHARALIFAGEPLPKWLTAARKKGLETV